MFGALERGSSDGKILPIPNELLTGTFANGVVNSTLNFVTMFLSCSILFLGLVSFLLNTLMVK